MKKVEFLNTIKASHPAIFEKIGEKRVALLIESILKAIKENLNSAEEGKVIFPGLGAFMIRKVQKDVKGESKTSKRIIFRAPKKDKPAGGGKRPRKKDKGEGNGGAGKAAE